MNAAYTFNVAECERAIVSAVNLVFGTPGDELQLVRMVLPETCPGTGDAVYLPFTPHNCGDRFVMTSTNNPIMVDTPGSYALWFVGANNPSVVIAHDIYNRACGNE